MTYILGADQHTIDELMLAASRFAEDIHDRVLLFDRGYWQLSAELYRSVQNSNWDDVILEPDMKASIKGEVVKFFDSREKYERLKVPWKRGIIYYGVCTTLLSLPLTFVNVKTPFLERVTHVLSFSRRAMARPSPSKPPCTCYILALTRCQPYTSVPSRHFMDQSTP